MEIIADKIVFGGNALGKKDGKNVFIPFAIPGEKLEVEITKSFKDYDVAKIKKIIIPSEKRVNPPCEYYTQCGGCNLLHVDAEYQKDLRKRIFAELFEQQGVKIFDEIQTIEGPAFNYRCRSQLNNGGFSEQNSNKIIPVKNCVCAEKKINEYLKNNPFETRPSGRVQLFGSDFSQENAAKIAIEEKKQNRNDFTQKNGKKYKIKKNNYFAGTVFSPENSTTVVLNGKKIEFDVRGFFQSNLFVFEKTLNLICQNLEGGNSVLDLYAGCGSISVFLADLYKNVTLVEHNRDALVFAEKNLRGKNRVSYGMSGAAWAKNCASSCGNFDACVVDPPRVGMENEICDFLRESNVKKIVSLSCNPSTHARDCKKLLKSGYKMKKIALLDFYPNTSHIESLAIFEK